MLAERKHSDQAAPVMDLNARRHISQCLRVEIGCLHLSPEVIDFLALLTLWENGTVSGRPAPLPPINPARDTGSHPS